ncbi:MAG: hypothetical protein VKJ04_10170 [Vampirovibrionales bacterium]|nr:hypothetical protein [Vampirovibrionales bacterium]
MIGGSILYNNLAMNVFQNGAALNLIIRAVARMDTIPEDRQADYTFRDIYLGLLNTIMGVWTFRLMESLYMVPRMVEALGLHSLGDEYKDVAGAKNYKTLPRALEHRMLGYLVNEKSFYAIADILRNRDLKKLAPGSKEYNELLVLAEQMQRRLDQTGYLKHYYGFNHEQAQAFQEAIGKIEKSDMEKFKVDRAGLTPKKTAETEKILASAIEKSREALEKAFGGKATSSASTSSLWQDKIFAHTQRVANKTGRELLHDMATSRAVQNAVHYSRKSGSWASMIGGLALNFLYFGLWGTWFDFNVLQPWQKILAEKRGTTREVVAPQVWSLIPAGLTATGLYFATKKIPGYATRFMATFGTAFVVYTVSVLTLIKHKLSKPPKGKYARLAEQSKLSHAPHHNSGSDQQSSHSVGPKSAAAAKGVELLPAITSAQASAPIAPGQNPFHFSKPLAADPRQRPAFSAQ